MVDPALDRPGSVAGDVAPAAHGNDAVLMPAKAPIGILALVEQDRPHGPRAGAEPLDGQGRDRAACAEQIVNSAALEQPRSGSGWGMLRKQCREWRKEASSGDWETLGAVLVQRHWLGALNFIHAAIRAPCFRRRKPTGLLITWQADVSVEKTSRTAPR